ncbi:hypothetical protein ACFL6M_06905 [Candidatus Eisenbacteria bacterium]|uniref:Uncharacterized protein n=1 Tax=Eiseniibacteriota bacterium TaxID=2212470 RepID=A0ABV6YLW8_UNCEI
MQNNILEGEDVSADAITHCMRTKHNAISMWVISGEEEVLDAVIAIASPFDHLDTIDIVLIPIGRLDDAGLQVESTEGVTPFSAFVEKHRDVVQLTHATLGSLARLIVDGIRAGRIRRYTRGDLRSLLRGAIEGGRLDIADLRESVRNKVC